MKKVRFYLVRKKDLHCLLSTIVVLALILTINIGYFIQYDISSVTAARQLSPDEKGTNISQNKASKARLAIIIDDFGQNRSGVKEMMSINRNLTFAIMPFLTFSRTDAEEAHKKGYEIIVHLPLEASAGRLSWVGPRPILAIMNDMEIQQIVMDSFDSVPYAVGANIHMGSKAAEEEHVISDILNIIKVKSLYFVDSRANKNPIGKIIADQKGIVCYNRDVFLDGKKPKHFIKQQLSKAADIALKKGYAIAIGHVGTEGGVITAEAILEALPDFEEKGVELVFVSQLRKN